MTRYLYWFPEEDFRRAKDLLEQEGFTLKAAFLTPCQVLRANGETVWYASPKVWSGFCRRQGSWYRDSAKTGQTMVLSARRLPAALDPYLDAELRDTDFQPDDLPAPAELQALVEGDVYQEEKPADWEKVGIADSIGMKILFRIFGFWKRGESLNGYWTSQRANHANFLERRFTARMDGEEVPYSVTENAGVCSSCAEFFNVISPTSRKLVRACPGAMIFGGAARDVYLDVQPQEIVAREPHPALSRAPPE